MVEQCQVSLKAKSLQSVHELCCSMVLLCQQSPHFLHTEHKREVQTFSAQVRACVCVSPRWVLQCKGVQRFAEEPVRPCRNALKPKTAAHEPRWDYFKNISDCTGLHLLGEDILTHTHDNTQDYGAPKITK